MKRIRRQLGEVVRECLGNALRPGVQFPGDDEDWIESAALDSMGLVDVLLAVEREAGVPGFFDSQEGRPPRTTSGVVQALELATAEKRVARSGRRCNRARQRRAAVVGIVGWGEALGARQVEARAVEEEFSLPVDTLREKAGIQSVSRAGAGDTEVSLAAKAARAALEEAGVSAADLDWIVATSETFLGLPSLGAVLHSQLLARGDCGVLDVGGACLGMLNALQAASVLLQSGRGNQALLISADVHSRLLAPGRVDGKFGGLFGDGASAFVLRRVRGNEKSPPYRIGYSCFGCAGASAGALRIAAGENSGLDLYFDGGALGRAAIRHMKRVAEELEAGSGVRCVDARAIACHQPNPRLLRQLAKELRVSMEKVPVVADACGNLGSSTCGVALCRALSQPAPNQARQRGPIFALALGPGMLWGGMVLF